MLKQMLRVLYNDDNDKAMTKGEADAVTTETVIEMCVLTPVT